MYSFYFLSVCVYYVCVGFIYIPFEPFSAIWTVDDGVEVDPKRFADLMRNTFLTTQFAKLGAKYWLPILLTRLGSQVHQRLRSLAHAIRNRTRTVLPHFEQVDEDVLEELARPPWDLFAEYDDSISQYSNLACFTIVFPFALLAALATNVLHQRLNMVALSYHHQRPVPERSKGIGAWFDILEFISHCAMLENMCIIMITMGVAKDMEVWNMLQLSSSHAPDGATSAMPCGGNEVVYTRAALVSWVVAAMTNLIANTFGAIFFEPTHPDVVRAERRKYKKLLHTLHAQTTSR
ncbi:hypothetical protein H310_12093 [Aphanomyces invadans]|uniref:Anoctamin transmembrane domain-containing protein n=1 Tax=Aphanomyces invadans TaxID=157072 RepID=A0A024TKB4_9STRA|nr:hypothetical protein H310_12093 [Aphanomyces invadans]ETV94061.1 hypothetical protein H310_12093 [Aphanomyces invadans]|eukprot:XP_008877264.1 hypothetical protein H310_12093 [Aphanomyces invadans]